MKAISFREKKALLITVGLIALSSAFKLWLVPMLEKNALLNKDILMARIKLEKYIGLLSREDFLKSQYPKLYAAAQRPQNSSQASTNALSELEDMARAAQLTIIDLRPQSVSAEKRKSSDLLIEMRTEGKIEDQMSFLYGFENYISFLKVKRFALNAKPRSQVLEGRYSIVVLD